MFAVRQKSRIARGGGTHRDGWLNPSLPQDGPSDWTNLLTVDSAMRYLGYTNRDSFLRMVRAHGIPRIMINKRVIRYSMYDLGLWLGRRAVRPSGYLAA